MLSVFGSAVDEIDDTNGDVRFIGDMVCMRERRLIDVQLNGILTHITVIPLICWSFHLLAAESLRRDGVSGFPIHKEILLCRWIIEQTVKTTDDDIIDFLLVERHLTLLWCRLVIHRHLSTDILETILLEFTDELVKTKAIALQTVVIIVIVVEFPNHKRLVVLLELLLRVLVKKRTVTARLRRLL